MKAKRFHNPQSSTGKKRDWPDFFRCFIYNYELLNNRTELSVKHGKQVKTYKFDHIFASETQSEFVKAICHPIPPNGTLIFSYGFTNAGKTYSILGEENRPGILPYLISSLGGTSFLTAISNFPKNIKLVLMLHGSLLGFLTLSLPARSTTQITVSLFSILKMA